MEEEESAFCSGFWEQKQLVDYCVKQDAGLWSDLVGFFDVVTLL